MSKKDIIDRYETQSLEITVRDVTVVDGVNDYVIQVYHRENNKTLYEGFQLFIEIYKCDYDKPPQLYIWTEEEDVASAIPYSFTDLSLIFLTVSKYYYKAIRIS